MNELTVSWDTNDKQPVIQEMMNLFRLKGYRYSDKERLENATIFVNELAKAGKPIKAVLNGIHKLKFEKLSRIDLADVVEASEESIEPESFEKGECNYCWGDGLIFMVDDNKCEVILLCICRNANSKAHLGLARWNGKAEQDRGLIKDHGNITSRILKLRFPEILAQP